MNAWSNIEVPPDDPEIISIDKFEKNLQDIPLHVRQIRQLISGFEVCHFKYQQHTKHIKDAIFNLRTPTDPSKIGSNHIKNGPEAWKKDKTGRSLTGQRYVWALKKWLDAGYEIDNKNYEKNLYLKISKWLGNKEPEKERLIRLLLARLLWDWESYEKLLKVKGNKELEYQACRMDICHYKFPENLECLLHGIGELTPVERFEGCGSCNEDIRTYFKLEFNKLNDSIKSIVTSAENRNTDRMKAWLLTCFAKTVKEQTGLKQPVEQIHQ